MLITLTTDFGLQDHFVGAMKGVIKSIAPKADIVDITHEIAAHRITEGAFVLDQCWRYYPKKTVHVVVVDPGVGSARRPILVQADGHSFVAPDNGILGMVMHKEKHTAREITAGRYFLQPVSKTFHGRDVFAPVAAHLAKGVPASKFGPKIEDAFRPAFDGMQRTAKRAWTGAVLKIDRFGNLITSIPSSDFPALSESVFEFSAGLEKISLMVDNYAAAPPGELFIIAGSAGYLEVCLNQGSAAAKLKVGAGAPVELRIW